MAAISVTVKLAGLAKPNARISYDFAAGKTVRHLLGFLGQEWNLDPPTIMVAVLDEAAMKRIADSDKPLDNERAFVLEHTAGSGVVLEENMQFLVIGDSKVFVGGLPVLLVRLPHETYGLRFPAFNRMVSAA